VDEMLDGGEWPLVAGLWVELVAIFLD